MSWVAGCLRLGRAGRRDGELDCGGESRSRTAFFYFIYIFLSLVLWEGDGYIRQVRGASIELSWCFGCGRKPADIDGSKSSRNEHTFDQGHFERVPLRENMLTGICIKTNNVHIGSASHLLYSIDQYKHLFPPKCTRTRAHPPYLLIPLRHLRYRHALNLVYSHFEVLYCVSHTHDDPGQGLALLRN